jgi:hypothetical protein
MRYLEEGKKKAAKRFAAWVGGSFAAPKLRLLERLTGN